MTTELLAAVERIKPVIQAHAATAEAERRLTGAAYDAMYEAGLFAMLAPRAYGGLEVHPVEAMRVWEAVARVDAAAAWNLVMNQCISAYAAWMSPEGARELFRHGPAITAGALNPPGAATRVEGGWRVTGRVPYGSGCHNARWLAMPAIESEGGSPKLDPETGRATPFAVFFPKEQATILDTWRTLGMRGTGSTDYAVEDLFVPDHMTAPVAPLARPAPGFEGPLFRMWPWTCIMGETTVSVGAAAAAVDEAVQLCRAKTAAYNVAPLREQQLPQFQLGKAKARVDASRDTLHAAASEAFAEVEQSGQLLSRDAKIRLQLAACFAVETCAEAVRFVNDAVGASAFREDRPFERHFRDTHTMLQHSSKSSARYASAGRLMLGLENDWVWLSF